MSTIGVDARTLSFPPRGVGNFARHLLLKLTAQSQEIRFLLFADQPFHPGNHDVLSAQNVRQVIVPPGLGYRFNIWQQLRLPLAAVKHRVDLMYYPASSVPWWQAIPSVVTIHDTKALRRRDTLLGLPGKDGGRILPRALKKARCLITVSDFTRKDLINNFYFPPEKIVTIYQGIGPNFRPLPNRKEIAAKVRQRYGITGKYLFALGCLGNGSMADKNTSCLLRTARHLMTDFKEPIQVILAGLEPNLLLHYEAEVRALGISHSLRLVGYISEAELIELYNCAELFIYPSLDEGFGLPPIEAMACGTIVVASDSTAIPEATGGLAFLVDSRDPLALAEKIRKTLELIGDQRFRAKRVQEGIEWAARFRWEETAGAYHEVFSRGLG